MLEEKVTSHHRDRKGLEDMENNKNPEDCKEKRLKLTESSYTYAHFSEEGEFHMLQAAFKQAEVWAAFKQAKVSAKGGEGDDDFADKTVVPQFSGPAKKDLGREVTTRFPAAAPLENLEELRVVALSQRGSDMTNSVAAATNASGDDQLVKIDLATEGAASRATQCLKADRGCRQVLLAAASFHLDERKHERERAVKGFTRGELRSHIEHVSKGGVDSPDCAADTFRTWSDAAFELGFQRCVQGQLLSEHGCSGRYRQNFALVTLNRCGVLEKFGGHEKAWFEHLLRQEKST